jgi:hypothetical protein
MEEGLLLTLGMALVTIIDATISYGHSYKTGLDPIAGTSGNWHSLSVYSLGQQLIVSSNSHLVTGLNLFPLNGPGFTARIVTISIVIEINSG